MVVHLCVHQVSSQVSMFLGLYVLQKYHEPTKLQLILKMNILVVRIILNIVNHSIHLSFTFNHLSSNKLNFLRCTKKINNLFDDPCWIRNKVVSYPVPHNTVKPLTQQSHSYIKYSPYVCIISFLYINRTIGPITQMINHQSYTMGNNRLQMK